MKIAIFVFVIAVAFAQQPFPCRSPAQFEGRVFTTDRSKQYVQYGRVSYDETQRRIRIIEEVSVGSARDYYDNLYLHNIGKLYSLNLRVRKCNVTNLTRPFRPFGVPPEAKFDGSASIGAAGVPGEFMDVNRFYGNFSDGDSFFGAVTSPDCYPVESAVRSEKEGFIQRTFFDINLGISDPNVFIPPQECA